MYSKSNSILIIVMIAIALHGLLIERDIIEIIEIIDIIDIGIIQLQRSHLIIFHFGFHQLLCAWRQNGVSRRIEPSGHLTSFYLRINRKTSRIGWKDKKTQNHTNPGVDVASFATFVHVSNGFLGLGCRWGGKWLFILEGNCFSFNGISFEDMMESKNQ